MRNARDKYLHALQLLLNAGLSVEEAQRIARETEEGWNGPAANG